MLWSSPSKATCNFRCIISRIRTLLFKGVPGSSLQGERNNEENDDLFELEENGRIVESHLEERRKNDVVSHDNEDLEVYVDQNLLSNNPPLSSDLPMSTPLTEESTENVSPQSPQVSLNPIPNEINEISVLEDNMINRYPQRSNRGLRSQGQKWGYVYHDENMC